MKNTLLSLSLALLLCTHVSAQCNWISAGPSDLDQLCKDQTNETKMALDVSGTPYALFRDWPGLATTVRKFNGTNWVTVGTGSMSPGVTAYNDIKIDAIGNVYVAYADATNSNKVSVQKYNGSSWVTVGLAGFSTALVDYVSLALDAIGTPYVAYKDNANGQRASVMKFNGTTWVQVGSAGFSAGTADWTSLAIDGLGNPYVAFVDGANGGRATVMKYTGTWTIVGSAGFSAGQSQYTSLAIDGSNNPHVFYSDAANGNKGTLMKYNGSSWITLGSAGFTPGTADYTSLALSVGGNPYVVFSETGAGGKVMKYVGGVWTSVGGVFSASLGWNSIVLNSSGDIFVGYDDYSYAFGRSIVKKFNGSTWSILGTAGFSPGAADKTAITTDIAGNSYVVFEDGSNGNRVSVMKYNGSTWTMLGSSGFSSGAFADPAIAVDASLTPYVVYTDQGASNRVSVKKYNGSSWVNVGSAGFSSGVGAYPSIAIDAVGTPYVAFVDGSNGNYATVMKYNGSTWVTVGSQPSTTVGISSATKISLAVDGTGAPYVAYTDSWNSYKASVIKYAGGVWTELGGPGISSSTAYYCSLAIDKSNTPYLSFYDVSTVGRATVMKYNGSSWVTVGSPGFSSGAAEYLSIALDIAGTPYVAFRDAYNTRKVSVMKYNGSSWITVANPDFSAGQVFYTSIAIDNKGIPIVAFSSGGAFAYKLDFPSTTSVNSPLCDGGNLILGATGGNSYAWAGPAAFSSTLQSPVVPGISSANDGTYTLTITSGTCFISRGLDIYVNSNPTVTVNSASICSGNTFTIVASGASTYTYSSGTNVVSPSVTTSYSVTGTSTAGCISTIAVSTITVSISPTISVNSGSICSGNSFTLVPSGADTYSFSSNANVVSPSLTTSYSVTGTSSAGCVSTNTAVSEITVHLTPTVSISGGSICAGQSFTLVPSGASSYTISGGATVVNPLSTTPYSVTGTSTAGCISTNTAVATITVMVLPTVAVNSGTICSGKVFTMIPSGAFTYTFSNGSATVNPAANSDYSVTGTSTAGCVSSNTAVASVTVVPLPTVSVNSGSICSGNSFTLIPSGALTYTISGGTATVSPSSTTPYSVTGTSAVGCVSSNTAVTTIIVQATPTVGINSGSICSGQNFTLVPSGASSYTISGGASVVSPLSTTPYSVTGTSTAGCISSNTAVATITVMALPVISVNSGTICSGKVFTMIPSGAFTYTFSNGSATVNPATNSDYSVTGTSTAGCVSSNTAVASVTVVPLPTVAVNSGTICLGQVFTMVPAGAFTYTFSNGSTTVNPSANTDYSVTGTSTAGCISSNTAVASVTVVPLPTVAVNSGTICSGQVFTMVPSGAFSYIFSNGSATVSPSANTDYSVTGTSAAGCVSSNTAVSSVTVIPLPLVSVNSGSVCSGKIFTMTPSGAFTYTFSNGSSTVIPLANSSYSVTGTSAVGCISSNTAVASVTVVALPLISVNSGSVCAGKTFTMVPSGALSYTFSNGSATVAPSSTSSYSVTGTGPGGCVSSNTAVATIGVLSLPSLSIIAQPSVICEGESAVLISLGADSYTWSTGANSDSISVSPLVTSSYTIYGTSAVSGCSNQASFTQTVDLCSGVENKQVMGILLKLYPNPNQGIFTIELEREAEISIFNPVGQLIAKGQLHAGANAIALEQPDKGIYFIQLKQDNSMRLLKVIKQ